MARMLMLTATLAICIPGCTAAKKTAGAVGTGIAATTMFVAGGIVNGILDDDEPAHERFAREEREREGERRWKQYWQDHPQVNPAMTKAFANE